jgi:DNA gyrase subunit A
MNKNEIFDNLNEEFIDTECGDVVSESMLRYGKYVIEERAIPALDGLKPSQRRFLYVFKHNKYINKGAKKLARIVGDTIGIFHPHGDKSVEQVAWNLAQVWKNNYPLVIGEGNYGNINGKNPAAMRYVEMKMNQKEADILFDDIEKDTVPFTVNYDETEKEPILLPVKLPVHIINGTTGIAYGMSTNVQPYNPNEIINLMSYLIDNKFWIRNKINFKDNEIRSEIRSEIKKIIKGCDYPTGTNIYYEKNDSHDDIIFSKNYGFRTRASFEINEAKRMITFTNVPYGLKLDNVKKELLKAQLDHVVDSKKRKIKKDEIDIIHISEAPTIQSSKDKTDGIIELRFKRGYDLNVELNKIWKLTSLDQRQSGNIIIINDKGVPEEITLLDNMIKFTLFREQIVERRVNFEINQLNRQLHLLKGFLKAISKKEIFIDIVTNIEDSKIMNEKLKKEIDLDDLQIEYILNVKVSKLTKKETKRVEEEVKEKETQLNIKKLIISTRDNIFKEVKKETESLKSVKRNRKSKILKSVNTLNNEDLLKNKEIILMLMNDNSIGTINTEDLKPVNRGGKIKANKIKEIEEFNLNIETLYKGELLDSVLLISDKGRIFREKVWKFGKKLTFIGNYLNLKDDEKIIKIIADAEDNKDLIFITRKGQIKRIDSNYFSNITAKSSKKGIELNEDDKVVSVLESKKEEQEEEIILLTEEEGNILRFKSNEIKAQKGGSSKGTRGIKKDTDILTGFIVKEEDIEKSDLILISNKGRGKKTSINEITLKKKGGASIKIFNNNKANGKLIGGVIANRENYNGTLILDEKGGVSIIKLEDLKKVARNTKGACLITQTEEPIIYCDNY